MHTTPYHTIPQVEGRIVVDMTNAGTTAVTPPGSIDLVEDVADGRAIAIAGAKNERPSLLKKMDGILNDYAGNGGGTSTIGGEAEKK
jgi:hypothetical protein